MNSRDFFDELELEQVIPKLLQYFYGFGLCGNVIWILGDEFKALHEIGESVEWEPEQQLHRHLRVQAVKPAGEIEVANLVKLFDCELTMPAHAAISTENGECQVLAWPIMNNKNRRPMAYILMTEIKKSELNKTELARLQDRVSRDLASMAKHIGFSIQHWNVQRMSFLDDLTGLYNQKYLSLVLENEILRSQRMNTKFSVLFMDIDYFKTVNDTKGHWVGSGLLVEIGNVLRRHLRKSDYAFRYGGDEFVAVLAESSAEGAKNAAERIRRATEATDFIVDGQRLKLTMSVGLATFPDHAKTHKDIIKMADEAMYCGKNKSRNVVFVAS